MVYTKKIEIYEQKPEGFKPLVEVAACYLEIDGKILLLKQGLAKPEVGAWGVPAGKLEKHETAHAAAQRELFEETGIQIEKPSQIHALGSLFIRKPEIEYVYHLFQVKIEKTPSIFISHEHQSYGWFPIHNLSNVNLMTGAQEALDHYQKRAVSI